MGSFPLIVRDFLTIVSQICSSCEFYCVDTLSMFSPLTAALHVVHWILNFLLLHCGYLGLWSIFSFHEDTGIWKT